MKKDVNNPTRLFDILPLLETRKSRRACFRFGNYELDAAHYVAESKQMAKALLAHGLRRGDTVALIAENRPEWNVIDMAVMQAGGILLPLCKGLTAEEYVDCIGQTNARILFLENKEIFSRFKLILPQLEGLSEVVLVESEDRKSGYMAMIEEGRKLDNESALAKRRDMVTTDDVCSIAYMGGGICNRFTHREILAEVMSLASSESNRRQAAAGNNALCTLYGRTKNYVCQFVGRMVNYPVSD